MSQRYHSLNEEIEIDFKVKVTINQFSNHNGFSENQIENTVKEFKEKIKTVLSYQLEDEYYGEDFLNSVDFVNYNVEILNR